MKNNPITKVACAIIEKEGKVLAAQRSASMSMALKWEFPGGKLHRGEDAATCLVREIMEELGVLVVPGAQLPSFVHHYDAISIELIPFICAITGGEMMLHEHRAVLWLSPHELLSLEWAAADLPVLDAYLEHVMERSLHGCLP